MDTGTFSFFAVGHSPITSALDGNGNPIRKRQQHRKSRNGCTNCKQRRVKCDEKFPSCTNCKKRNFKCNISETSDRTPESELHSRVCRSVPAGRTQQANSETLPDLSTALQHSVAIDFESNGVLSVQDKSLFRHFQEVTSYTLAMHTDLWRTLTLSSALHHDYLRSAVLLLASAHINHSLPTDHPDRLPVLDHFTNALSSLRLALADEITGRSLDSIISCSMLLIHYSWAAPDYDPVDELDVTYLFRETFSLANGTKDCVVTAQHLLAAAAWSKVLKYSPRASMEKFIRETEHDTPSTSALLYHCFLCGLGTKAAAGASADNKFAIDKLLIVLEAIEISQSDLEGSGILSDIVRYLFTWPTQCTKGFVEQLRENNAVSLTILLYYCAAIVRISSEKLWWIQDRALFMYSSLKTRLSGTCDLCTRPAITLAEGNKNLFSGISHHQGSDASERGLNISERFWNHLGR